MAFPLYFTAFVLHLLCAGATSLAQKIAGEEPETSTSKKKPLPFSWRDMFYSGLAATVFAGGILAIAAMPAVIYHPKETSAARLEPVNPMKNEEFAKTAFTPAMLEAVLPNIRMVACIFSEKAVRHYVSPSFVTLPSCGSRDFQVTVSENLIDVSVSGIATIEAVDHPFNVTMQHNPPSVTEDGLIITAIEVGDFPKVSPKGSGEMVSGE